MESKLETRLTVPKPAAYEQVHDEATPMMNPATTPTLGHQPARPLFRQNRPGEGVNSEVATKPLKIGAVSIKPLGKNHWQLRYHDPASGRDVRRRLSGLSQREVHGVAGSINHELLAKGGYVPEPEKPKTAPLIAEGLAEAIRLSNTRPETQRERARRASKFVEWLAEHYPCVVTWDQLLPAMVKTYMLELEQRGKAFDTVRLDLAPVKLTWRYMVENYGELVRPMPRIRQTPPPKREIKCLEPVEVAALLDWLRGNAPDLWPMACLQGLAGLRMLEAAPLRIQDVDFERQTVEVADTGHHRPKNDSSERTIPICEELVNILRVVVAGQKVRLVNGELFTNRRGNMWTVTALGHRWQKCLRRAAREMERPRLAETQAHRLRAAFATMVDRAGIPDRVLKAYLGHSSGDVLGDHYRRIDLAELRAVSSLMNGWRDRIDSPDSGNILATASGR